MNKIVLIGGTFDKSGGKSSYIVHMMMQFMGIGGLNGGHISELDSELELDGVDTLIWMPNIDNSEPKFLPKIKKAYPNILLVQSKRITDGNYTEADIVGRLLKSKSLLGITIEKKNGVYEYMLLDPLGNLHAKTTNLGLLTDTLVKLTNDIRNMSRMPSVRKGMGKNFSIDYHFLQVVRDFGERFSKFVNTVNPHRLLGNASTRCEGGFPAVKSEGRIFVTRRNVDKKTLNASAFVEVELDQHCVNYYGNNKPSVDTPVQLDLFRHFPNINYMIHGHVYVEGAPMTENKIPCGYIEEFADIVAVIDDPSVKAFSVNLLGHGCIIACDDLEYFETIKLVGRPFPELPVEEKTILDIFHQSAEEGIPSHWCVQYSNDNGVGYEYFESHKLATKWAGKFVSALVVEVGKEELLPKSIDGNLSTALLFLDRAIAESETETLLCNHCGEYESIKDLDLVEDIKSAKAAILQSIKS